MTSINQQIQPQDQITLGDAIQQGITSLVEQLQYALKRIEGDDLFVRYVTNAINQAETLMIEGVTLYNQDVDSFDALQEELQNKSLALGMVRSELDGINQRHARAIEELKEAHGTEAFNLERKTLEQETKITHMEGLYNESMQAYKRVELREGEIKRQLRELQLLEPEKLKKENKELKADRIELRAANKELNQKYNKASAAFKTVSEKLSGTEALNFQLAERNTELMRHVERNDGTVSSKRFYVTNDKTGIQYGYYPYRYSFGFTVPHKAMGEHPFIISGLKFHYQLRSDIGYAIDFKINEWAWPCYQELDIFTDREPEGYREWFHEVFYEELTHTHPQIVKRIDWAKSVPLEDIEGINAKLRQKLMDQDITCLFDIVKLERWKLVRLEGVGEKTCNDLHSNGYAMARKWEEENGAIEDIKRVDLLK